MSNMILGLDIGEDRLKMALCDDGQVIKTASAEMPDNLVKDGHFTSMEIMSDLIIRTMKENDIRAKNAAFVMSNESVYVKNVRMPMMNVDQLALNLPYEFNDYITGEIKDYVFDYAVLPDSTDKELSLMAVGAERSDVEGIQKLMSRSGLKLVKAAPPISTYIALIRSNMDVLKKQASEFGILDLGHQAVRMYIFNEDRHAATRVLESGLSSLNEVISELYGVEKHLAHSYILNNYENCLDRDECKEAYESIAVELMRAVNFYKFSNPDNTLSDMWVCGGGAYIRPLDVAIGEMLDMRLHAASELVKDGNQIPGCNSFVQAIGVTMD